MWVMLNPSTADGERDDPTIRRIVAFSRFWKFDALVAGNLFGYRTKLPRELKYTKLDRVGPENDKRLLEMASISSAIVYAWGTHTWARSRAEEVMRLLAPAPGTKVCLGTTTDGSPRHPLYVRGDFRPMHVTGANFVTEAK